MTAQQVDPRLKAIVSGVPTTVDIDERMIDVLTPQTQTVNSMLALIGKEIGAEPAKQFAELIVLGKVPDNATRLVEFLYARRAHAVARVALKRLTHAGACDSCDSETTWKPDKKQ